MSTRRISELLSIVASIAVLPACGSSAKSPPTVQSEVGLEAFETCGELERYIEDAAVELMRNQLAGDYWYYWAGFDARNAEAGGAPPGASAPGAYTRTNVQVAGVDEADFVETNGTHIFVLSGDSLYITRTWPAASMTRLARVELEGYSRDMYLDEERERVVVLSAVNAPYVARSGASVDCLATRACEVWAPATKVTVIDVATPDAPIVTGELYLPGWQQGSRRVGSSVRVVLGDGFRWPEGLVWWPEWDEALYRDEVALREAREALADDNEVLIRARSLEDWLPAGSRRLSDGTLVDLSYDCTTFHHTNASTWLGFTTVATVNLDDLAAPPSRTSIVAYASEVYASPERLYLAMSHWWWWPQPGNVDHTYLFAFDITDPARASLVAAGGVPGTIVDQFSLDEHQGYLRVATTVTSWVEDEEHPLNRWGVMETANRVSVLGRSGGELVVVGRTPDLAPGERLQSSRFLGERGFVVTFRQVDPFYTVDLSDPTAPVVVGELKVPGFSTYLHPLDADHLLALGVYLPEPDEHGQVDWQSRRMKLSIFDVSDFASPRESFTALVGTAYGWSDAAWDHKAFNYFPERGWLAIPFADYRPGLSGDAYWSEMISELKVFSVGSTTGIAPLGVMSMSDVYRELRDAAWSWRWSPWISRSVMADDFVYAISDAGIRVAHVDALEVPLATVLFDNPASE